VRLSWLPAHLPAVLAMVRRLREESAGPVTFTGRVSGAGALRLEGDERECATAIAMLRASDEVGHVVVLRASRVLKEQVDVWGPALSSAQMARALKRTFDPAGILNAGRGPI